MPFSPLRPTVAQWCILAAAVAGFGYLLIDLEESHPGRRSLPDGDHSTVEYLDADGGTMTVEEVAALPNARWHRRMEPGFSTIRKPQAQLWSRVHLKNPRPETTHGMLADAIRFSDRVDCFYRGGAGGETWVTLRAGEWTPAAEKTVWGRENAFPVSLPAGGEQTVYLRSQDYFGVWQQYVWWPQQSEFYAAQLRATLAEGLYFGTLLALLFYNAILWLKLRLPPTGRYLLYLGSFTLFVFVARSAPQMLGWSIGSPWLESLQTAFLAASGVFLLAFAENFLELPHCLPCAVRPVRILRSTMAALAAVSLVAPWLGLARMLVYPVLGGVVVHLVVLGLAIAARRAGASQASYVMLAIGALFAGLIPAVAVWLQVLEIEDAARLVMAGSALEMLLLAVVMSDRIGLIQTEKIAAQAALLREAEQRETMQEAYADDLALEVRERTAELEAANADKDRILTVLGHDLRSPLTGLTRSAEHWAEQQATDTALRKFMVEAAQTGRHLLLMIEDLVMWARLRAGRGHKTVHPLTAIVEPVLSLHRPQAEAGRIALEARVPPGLFVWTDLVPVQALLRNLLSNALRAARQSVIVEANLIAEKVEITVRDDGPGLSPILETALASGDPADLPDSQGLGLRLCLEISRALDLHLTGQPLPAGGTEFRFSLTAVVT